MSYNYQQTNPYSPNKQANTPERQLLAELLHEQEKLKPFAQVLPHCSKLLAAEISRLQKLTSVQDMHEITPNRKIKRVGKLYVPVLEYPNFNFIGRILGPRGLYLQGIEKQTNCKIFIRGQGSMRDKQLENDLRGKHGYEHLEEPLHILIEAEGSTEEEAEKKFQYAKDVVSPLLVPTDEKKDYLKKRQLRELAMLKAKGQATPIVQHSNLKAPRMHPYRSNSQMYQMPNYSSYNK